MSLDPERAAMHVREALRRHRAREAEACEQTEGFDPNGLPRSSPVDLERVAAYLESAEEVEQAIQDFRDSLVPPT